MNESGDQGEAADDPLLLDGALIKALETILPRYFRAVRWTLEQAEGTERLTLPQFRCLQAIAADGTKLTTQLAWQMGVTLPTITSRIDGLVERGLVERQPDPRSRRQVLLSLTSAGQTLLASYQQLVDTWLRNLLAGMDPERKRHMFAGLKYLELLLDDDLRTRAGRDAARAER